MFNSPAKDSTLGNIKDASCDMSDNLHVAANNAGRKVRSMVNAASDEISHASDKVTGEIRSNPVRSTMIALGIGAVIGALLRK